MRFGIFVGASIAFIGEFVSAQTPNFDLITKPHKWETISAGSTFTIKWKAPAKYADTMVDISLIGGKTQDSQAPVSNITLASIKNSAGAFGWNVDSSLGQDAVYGIVIKQADNPKIFQYSNPFHIKGSTGSTTLSVSSTASTTTTTTPTTMTTLSPSTPTTAGTSTTSSPGDNSTATPPTVTQPTSGASINGIWSLGLLGAGLVVQLAV